MKVTLILPFAYPYRTLYELECMDTYELNGTVLYKK